MSYTKIQIQNQINEAHDSLINSIRSAIRIFESSDDRMNGSIHIPITLPELNNILHSLGYSCEYQNHMAIDYKKQDIRVVGKTTHVHSSTLTFMK